MTKFASFVGCLGGMGKTTLVLNIASVLAYQHGRHVLLIDIDNQKNISKYKHNIKGNLNSISRPLYVIDEPYFSQYDYVMFDCPPYVNDTVRSAIRRSDLVIAPVIYSWGLHLHTKLLSTFLNRDDTNKVFYIPNKIDNHFPAISYERCFSHGLSYSYSIFRSSLESTALINSSMAANEPDYKRTHIELENITSEFLEHQ